MHEYNDTDEELGEEDQISKEGLRSKGGPKYVTRLDTLFIVVISPLFLLDPLPIHTLQNIHSSDWKIPVTNRDGSILVRDLMHEKGGR